MKKIRQWVGDQINKSNKNPLWALFLTGIKGQLDTKNPKPYNFYMKILSIGATISVAYYFLLFRKNQMDIYGHNILVPNYIYRVRE